MFSLIKRLLSKDRLSFKTEFFLWSNDVCPIHVLQRKRVVQDENGWSIFIGGWEPVCPKCYLVNLKKEKDAAAIREQKFEQRMANIRNGVV
jgi:hypothetical protein